MTARIITLSDKGSRGERTDTAGPAAAEMLKAAGFDVTGIDVLPDEKDLIISKLKEHAGTTDIIITTGGTGLAPRDVTPEATRQVIDREVPGIAEAMRAAGLKKTNRAMLTRGIAGAIGQTLVINMPGSQKAVVESLEAVIDVLAHAVETLKGSGQDCGR